MHPRVTEVGGVISAQQGSVKDESSAHPGHPGIYKRAPELHDAVHVQDRGA